MRAFSPPVSEPTPHKSHYGVDSGSKRLPHNDSDPFLAGPELVTDFLTGYRGNTADAYQRDLADYVTHCEQSGVDPVTAKRVHLNGYLRDLEERGLSPATVARRLVALRGFYRYALLEGHIERSPAEHIRYRQPRSEPSRRSLTLPQLRALLDVADRDGPRSAALVWLLATTGIRISEACNARGGDILPGTCPSLQVIGKGRRRHLVPLVAPTWARLAVIAPSSPEGALFATSSGRGLDRRAFARTLNRLARKAGIASISPHVLRHTFVTLARQQGCDLPDIQDAVGHANPATTRRYDHYDLTTQRHPAQRLAVALS
jgi:integrase/recombinase XerD